ncbi:hypothetical protein SESBI_23498 [Sesbania bispinosa]|nr:hypothetical protein SESBI_23498 [Sesbania bispinosa]
MSGLTREPGQLGLDYRVKSDNSNVKCTSHSSHLTEIGYDHIFFSAFGGRICCTITHHCGLPWPPFFLVTTLCPSPPPTATNRPPSHLCASMPTVAKITYHNVEPVLPCLRTTALCSIAVVLVHQCRRAPSLTATSLTASEVRFTVGR